MNALPRIDHGIYSWKHLIRKFIYLRTAKLDATCAPQAVYWIPKPDAGSIMLPTFCYESGA